MTLTVVVIVALVGSGLLALVWSQQRRLIYFPSPGPLPSAATILPAGKDVVLDTEDGIRLGAWYFPAASHDRAPAVVIFNGNGGYRSVARRPRGGTEPTRVCRCCCSTTADTAAIRVARPRRVWPPTLGPRRRGWRSSRTSTRAGSRTSANPSAPQSQSAWPCSDRLRRWCCGRRSRRWPTSACCTTRGCRCGGC